MSKYKRNVDGKEVWLLGGHGCFVHDDCFTCPLPDGACVWNPHEKVEKQKLQARVIRLSLAGETSPREIASVTGVSFLGVIKYLRTAKLM